MEMVEVSKGCLTKVTSSGLGDNFYTMNDTFKMDQITGE